MLSKVNQTKNNKYDVFSLLYGVQILKPMCDVEVDEDVTGKGQDWVMDGKIMTDKKWHLNIFPHLRKQRVVILKEGGALKQKWRRGDTKESMSKAQ